ncbi:hypothetical protein TrispH2_007822 [Trichoplax sp. H2]|nr:hypothetical protein TrispH2_007822 [Trichoplax sp. H2]|eukprot:RDD38592.1 hypothetical protein TrispH2_007822 [Trichoplax sp. H2]
MLKMKKFIVVIISAMWFYQLTNATPRRFTSVEHKRFVEIPKRFNDYIGNSRLLTKGWEESIRHVPYNRQILHPKDDSQRRSSLLNKILSLTKNGTSRNVNEKDQTTAPPKKNKSKCGRFGSFWLMCILG